MRKVYLFTAAFIAILVLAVSTALAADIALPTNADATQKLVATIVTLAAGVIFIAVCLILAMREGNRLFLNRGATWPFFLLIAAVAVAMRVGVGMAFEGYTTDMACFKSWAVTVYQAGPAGFYTIPDYFADYPPGYMYILYVVGWLREVFAIDYATPVFTLLVKLPSIIAELVTAVVVYRVGKKQIGSVFGLMAAALVLFNPAMLFNSAAWGQIDAVFTLFMVLTLLYLKKENYLLGALFFAIALLIKPQAIMFAPVVGLCYIFALFKRGSLKRALVGIFGGAAIFTAVIALAAIPFTGTQEPLWIIGKYSGTINFYPYTSLNAFNLFALLGGNFGDAEQAFLGLTYASWGWILIGLTCVLIVFLQWRSRETRPLFDLGAFLIVSVFMLSHAMHERYILPAGILLIFAYVFSRDNWALLFAAAYTGFALAEQMLTLYAPQVAVDAATTMVMSIIGLALWAVYTVVTVRRLASGKVLIKSPAIHS